MSAHPGVRANPTGKELHFFDRFWDQPFGAHEASEYQRWFARPPGCMSGEWTPSYMFDVWAPGLLKLAAPDARLLVMLRDPLERYVSGLTHYLQRGAPHHPLVAGDAFRRGLYADQVLRLHEHLGPDQVLVLQYEACIRDPARELARTYRFLGLEPSELAPERLDRVVYGTRQHKEAVDPSMRMMLIDAYQRDIRRLTDVLPELDLDLWPNFSP
ncbi:MAG: sulfotransferase family protein [Acidimicrobiales bacterium]